MKDWSAVQLANALDGMHLYPHNTGGLSMLEEATLPFGSKYPDVAGAQQAFATARHVHIRSYSTATGNYSQDAWARR